MADKNVLRGRVVTFSFSEYGGFGMTFAEIPAVSREQVILPDWQLAAIEEHAFGITDMRAELVAAGQHLKRGLLLYGPPGTGKTHTISHLLGQMSDRTTIILSGASGGAIGQAGTLARKLAPATIVIEDVDLIGMDRGLPGGEHNPMLFQLLNEMDGLQADDDVLFILTTNRADHRRGDGAGLRRHSGAAAAFIKEVARRAPLRSLRHGESLSGSVVVATGELQQTSTPLLRASLAAATGNVVATPPPPPTGGWSAFSG